jgi:predicted dehydrogenase
MRSVRVDGTRGSAWGESHALDGWLKVADHASGRIRREKIPTSYDGHGGGEQPLFRDFLSAIERGVEPSTSAAVSLESHRMAFAAMTSAETGTVVDLSSDPTAPSE